jgi:SOS response regulatory protein OraA/RecX
VAGEPPRLTAVRRTRRGRVELEVDGRRWRVVPDEVVLRCGLAPGIELDRPLLRELRRELLRAEALGLAVRTVARRDLSERRLRARLAARGVRRADADGAVATLAGAGVVDDARAALSRARSLAERGWGDAAVAARLADEGFGSDEVGAALAELPPERRRAEELAARGGDPRRTWRLLARRGFAPETVEDVLGVLDADR